MRNLLILFLLALTLALQAQTVLTPFSAETDGQKLWGYKDALGHVVTEPKYTQCPYVYSFQPFAQVDIKGKKAIINQQGKEITGFLYDEVNTTPYDGLMSVSANRKYGFIDTTGMEVVPLVYSRVKNFNSGLALVQQGNEKSFIDTKGNTVIVTTDFEQTHDQFGNGLCGVKLSEKWGFMDTTGKVVIPYKYDKVEPMTEGVAVVVFGGKPTTWGGTEGGKFGFIDKSGKEITEMKYSFAGPFVEGLAIVSKGSIADPYKGASGGKWGYVDKTGKEVATLKYDFAGHLDEGMGNVNLNGKWIDEGTGITTIRGGKWGYVDSKGKEVIPPQYDFSAMFMKGVAKVQKDGQSFTINKKGEKVGD